MRRPVIFDGTVKAGMTVAMGPGVLCPRCKETNPEAVSDETCSRCNCQIALEPREEAA